MKEYIDSVRVSGGTKYAIVIPGRKRLKVVTQGRFRPKIDGDMVELYGKEYCLDPTRMGRITGKRLRSLYLLPVDYHIQFWKENNPEAIPLFDDDENPTPNRTGEKIAMFVGEKAIQKVIGVPSSWFMYILLLAAGAFIGYILGGYIPTDGVSGGP